MDIRVLQYFLAVAREENITAAAESLHMTQPPLSRQLKELEEELGKTLFIRGKRKITLTEEGIILRKRAEEMVELLEKTKAEIHSANENINGCLLYTSIDSTAKWLQSFHQWYMAQQWPPHLNQILWQSLLLPRQCKPPLPEEYARCV